MGQQLLHNVLFYAIVFGVAVVFMALASRRGLTRLRVAVVGGVGVVIGFWCALIVAGSMGCLWPLARQCSGGVSHRMTLVLP